MRPSVAQDQNASIALMETVPLANRSTVIDRLLPIAIGDQVAVSLKTISVRKVAALHVPDGEFEEVHSFCVLYDPDPDLSLPWSKIPKTGTLPALNVLLLLSSGPHTTIHRLLSLHSGRVLPQW